MNSLEDLEKKINSELTTKIKSTKINHEHICINIENENLLEVVLFLKKELHQLDLLYQPLYRADCV